jgi:hypothetical protein
MVRAPASEDRAMAMVDEPQKSVQPVGVERATQAKSKSVAVVLAVLLAFWTWLYTYKVDAGKFWAGLGLTIVGIFLSIMWIGLPISLAVWLWAVLDTVSKSRDWYAWYPDISRTRSRKEAQS